MLRRSAFAAALLVGASLCSNGSSAPFVYEGYNAAPVTLSSLTGIAGATSVGLSGTWTDQSTAGASARYEPSGLYFSNLATLGGNSRIDITGGDSERGDASRTLNATRQGTIFGSFLVQPMSDVNANDINSILVARVADLGFPDQTDLTPNIEFQVRGDVFGGQTGGANIDVTGVTNAGTPLDVGDTSLVLFRVTGLTDGVAAANQTITAWILNEAQFNNFKAGGVTDAELDAAVVGTAANQVLQRGTIANPTGTARLTSSDFLHLFNAIGSADARYDEIRFSDSSLNDTVPLTSLSTSIITPTSATATTTNAGSSATAAVNSLGLSGASTTDPLDPAAHAIAANTQWLSATGQVVNQVLKIDLGKNFDLDYMRVWNYNEAGLTDRGIQSTDVYTSTTGIGDPLSNPGQWTLLLNDLFLAEATGTGTYSSPQIVDFLSAQGAFVAFVVNSNHGNSTTTNAGLAEVQFFGTAVVPEPASVVAWLAAGIVAISVCRRTLSRRRGR